MTTAKTTRKTKSTSPKLPSSSKSKRRAVVTPKIDSLPTNPFVFEILDLASQQRSVAKKIETLKTYEHNSIKSILIWNFDPSVISLLPEGEVPYGESEDQQLYKGTLSDNIKREAEGGESATGQDLDGRGRTSLRREWANLYHYVKGGNDTLSGVRREMMFINLLQGLHPKEAEVLILTKDKKLTDKYKITQDIVTEAYPDINWGGRS
tara:strand:- start:963 stop:1586 length:624 start_codon:yes stop_codon:yes gene_type:complete